MATISTSNMRRTFGRAGFIAIFTLVFAIVIASCTATSIGPGERGVKFSLISGGTIMNRTYGEGLQLRWPWETMYVYEIRSQTANESMDALSNNGLQINLDVSVRYRPDGAQLAQLHTAVGPDYYNRIIQPEMRSAVREVVGRFTPEELYSSKRSELQTLIQQRVQSALRDRNVVVEAVLIRDVVLPEQIKTAIENKLKEEQEVQRLAFTIDKERREAERKRIEAEGQAEYQRIITQSLSPQYLQFQGIQVTRELAQSENAKVVVIGSGRDGLPLILGGQ